ncbi:LSU ribosomal protein L32P [Haloactinospora alba]|uniref:Large ribosomal subunit protein bL32 n=1 Tax=Haloactinospora alba TaxID=405555 RepID=A0A543NFW9_9ACTN|nr:50S ribosomal protein L32 [Haloactinospora alba]TQN30691.1 LSU ribosomal protein L32P [Haloactinospora alba]
MAVPKQKKSRSNTRKRRSQWTASRPNLVTCQRCRGTKLSHTACPTCGTYRNRQVVKPA